MTRSLLDLPYKLRAPFFVIYLLAQITLLIRAQRSPDFIFGFQMFNASSDMTIRLFRRVHDKRRTRIVPVRDGAWQAKDGQGHAHAFRWQDRVRDGVLGTLDAPVHASYGLDAQLFRLQVALRDVAAHIPDDRDTLALVVVVDTLKNGRQRRQFCFEAARP